MPRHIRVIPIAVTTWPDEATRTSNSACVGIAEATFEGRTYTARSRHGPANQLARQLIAAGLPDRPRVIRYRGLAGTMTYRSRRATARAATLISSPPAPWSRFCGPARRLSAPIVALITLGKILIEFYPPCVLSPACAR